ncbi:hypothetical protein BB560_006025 [Smittium megazygosporum]|uniref:Uncharacterized protein n=1 Tax=Smittium megazygosporum TaxID=133381 RepID=A0A2T9YKM2_9FUNG|nr:hypothetical protein BB560_006025 [Smittium megazygosporum]
MQQVQGRSEMVYSDNNALMVYSDQKEKHGESTIEKRIGKTPITGNTKTGYLNQNLLNYNVKIGSQRINKHVNVLVNLIRSDNGKKKPKSCAVGTTLATTSGATYDDVVVRGFWLSRRIF